VHSAETANDGFPASGDDVYCVTRVNNADVIGSYQRALFAGVLAAADLSLLQTGLIPA